MSSPVARTEIVEERRMKNVIFTMCVAAPNIILRRSTPGDWSAYERQGDVCHAILLLMAGQGENVEPRRLAFGQQIVLRQSADVTPTGPSRCAARFRSHQQPVALNDQIREAGRIRRYSTACAAFSQRSRDFGAPTESHNFLSGFASQLPSPEPLPVAVTSW